MTVPALARRALVAAAATALVATGMATPYPEPTAAMTANSVKARDTSGHVDFPQPSLPAANGEVYAAHFAVGRNYPGRRLRTGAVPPGTQTYPVPADARYVSLAGSDSNPGTVDRPFRTISAATRAAGNGGTVVVRAGVYHEDVLVYPHDGLTVEASPGEAVWLDGAEPVSGWTRSGDVWVRSGWTAFFDSSPTYATGAPDGTAENWRWIDPRYPMASHPDQIWVDGRALTQVPSRAAVTEGTFYVDRAAHQLVMGGDPTGRTVEASTLGRAMSIRSRNSLIRGFGVRRYADSVPTMGAVSSFFPGVTLDNMTIIGNAATGFFAGAPNITVRNVTVRNNGLLGIDSNHADGLTVASVRSEANNSQHFNNAPVSGAMKITSARNITVRDSAFVNNAGQGPWFDESTYNVAFTHNDVVGNTGNGLVLELSDHATVANNIIAGNALGGLAVMNTGNVSIWNNTIARNGSGIDITQDSRRASDVSAPGHDSRRPMPDPTVPWITRSVSVANNVVSQATGESALRVADWSREFTGGRMLASSEGNLFHRASAAAPTCLAVWSAGAGAHTTMYSSLEAYQNASGRDATSALVTGASPLTSSLMLTYQYASRASAARPIPSRIASAVPQLALDARILGATAR